jgi:hypothetical protein
LDGAFFDEEQIKADPVLRALAGIVGSQQAPRVPGVVVTNLATRKRRHLAIPPLTCAPDGLRSRDLPLDRAVCW